MHRWLKVPAFCAALRGEQAAQLEQITRRLSYAAGGALDALERGLQAEEPMASQLRASDIVIRHMLKARELLELETRLTALEHVTYEQGADDEA